MERALFNILPMMSGVTHISVYMFLFLSFSAVFTSKMINI